MQPFLQYLASSIFGSTLSRFLFLANEMYPQSMILALPHFTEGMLYSNWCLVLIFFYMWYFFLCITKGLILVLYTLSCLKFKSGFLLRTTSFSKCITNISHRSASSKQSASKNMLLVTVYKDWKCMNFQFLYVQWTGKKLNPNFKFWLPDHWRESINGPVCRSIDLQNGHR